MKVNVGEPINDYKGQAINEGDKVIQFRDAIYTILNSFLATENPDVETKKMCYFISSKIFATDIVDLSVEEAAFIKLRAGIVSTPLVYGRICDLIDSNHK